MYNKKNNEHEEKMLNLMQKKSMCFRIIFVQFVLYKKINK